LHGNCGEKLREVVIVNGGDFEAFHRIQKRFHGKRIDNEGLPVEKALPGEVLEHESLYLFQRTGC
jgi:hypothetical protein